MRVKKIILLILFVLLLGIGCKENNINNKCKHEIETVASKEASCTKEGNVEYFYCTKCNKYYIDKELTVEKDYKELIINKTNHIESDWIIDIEATCTNEGLKHKECTVCKEKLQEEVIEEKEHNYTKTIINPTCTDKGYILYVCSCGDEYKDNYVDELGHNYSTSDIVFLDNGNKAVTRYNCSNCNNYKDEAYTGYYLLNDEAYEFDNSGNRVTLNKSFIEVNNNIYYIINNIIVKNYYIVDGIIYDFGNNGIKQDTVLTDKVITIDDSKYYVINNVIQKNTYIVYEQKVYYFDEDGRAIVNTTYNGYVFGTDGYLIGSDILIEINKVIYYITNNIASIHEHNIKHISYKEATCTENGNIEYYYCKKCDKCYKDSTCIKEIIYNDTIIKASHDIIKYDGKESTCETQGYEAYETCSKCSYTTYELSPLKEHTLTNWIIDIEATCTRTGSKHKECIVCKKAIETETIDILGHNYVNNLCTNCNIKKIEVANKEILIDTDYIYFGEYPQTLKEESVTIVSDEPDSDSYYLGSDGERYAKVVAKPCSSSYFFNDKITKIVDETTYYFKVEPIRWRIEWKNSNTYRLICDLIMDCQMYYSSKNERTIDGKTIYADNYKYSDIRSWLNNEFLNKAFSEELQEYINVTEVDNSTLPTWTSNEYACENTMDKIYLSSYEEIQKSEYGYNTSPKEDLVREKQLTDYAKAMGCYTSTGNQYFNNGQYWLRLPYNSTPSTCIVNVNGDMRTFTIVNNDSIGVAPALIIQID